MSSIKLISLCHAHLDEIVKFKLLENMLTSWNNQKFKTDMFISLSASDKLAPVLDRQKDILTKKFDKLHIFTLSKKLSGFEHYKVMIEMSKEKISEKSWVIFSGGYDIWHINRSSIYADVINDKNDNDNLLYVRIPYYYVDKPGEAFDQTNTKWNVHNEKHSYGRYFEYSCKLATLMDFMDRAGDFVLKHRFSDIFFVKYLFSDKKTEFTVIENLQPNIWMYYNRITNTLLNDIRDNTTPEDDLKSDITLFLLHISKRVYNDKSPDELYELFKNNLGELKPDNVEYFKREIKSLYFDNVINSVEANS